MTIPMSPPGSPIVALHNDEPSCTDEALRTFAQIKDLSYATKNLGKSRQDEFMTCDCKKISDENGTNLSCGENSDCINRLTSIECNNDKATHCGPDCKNQRFQKHEYASVDVISAGKKGYGLRALEDIPSGAFIYEYIGEVIDETKFTKRMKQYEAEERRHFYFMMLQKGEFIDATCKGSLARFCNHSCDPNSFVDKWVVKGRLRMGIFAKRDISGGEEVTFDYNVDRYGSQVQPCYCGANNCVGYLGGKTQTQAAYKLPRILVDALGLDEDDERQWVSICTKNKKKQQQPEEFAENLPMKPIDEDNVSKVMGCLLQCEERWLIIKLIGRIQITEEVSVHSRVMRMHGYEIFSILLRDWSEEYDIVEIILQILIKWPKLTKNKISSSKIESTVNDLAQKSESNEIKSLATKLLADWSNLQMAYRIPRRAVPDTTPKEEPETKAEPEPERKKIKSERDHSNGKSHNNSSNNDTPPSSRRKERQNINKKQPPQQPRVNNNKPTTISTNNNNNKPADSSLPPGWESAVDKTSGKTYYFNRSKNETTWEKPQKPEQQQSNNSTPSLDDAVTQAKKNKALQQIIQQATSTYLQQENLRQNSIDSTESTSNNTPNENNGQDSAEKVLTKTFARYVPNIVSRYEKELGHENVKKFSKEIVQILVSKELRPGHTVKNPKELSDEKKSKVKKFIKMYMTKVVEKHREKRKRKNTDNGEEKDDTRRRKTKQEQELPKDTEIVFDDEDE